MVGELRGFNLMLSLFARLGCILRNQSTQSIVGEGREEKRIKWRVN